MTTLEEEKTLPLLDYLARQIGCNYVSDLRDATCRRGLRRAIDSIPAERFSLRHWLDAAAYLGTEESVAVCGSAEEVKERLCRRLNEE